MISFRTIAFFLLILLFSFTLEAKKKEPIIEFESQEINLGNVPYDKKKTVVFNFKNVGKGKLVINSLTTSCGCTTGTFPKDFIKPGGTGKIVVTYDGTGAHPGPFVKRIILQTNCSSQQISLKIRGNMTNESKNNSKK